MKNGFQWTDEEDTFRDVPDEVTDQGPGGPQGQGQPQFQAPTGPAMTREQIIAQAASQVAPIEEVSQEFYQASEDEDEDYTEVLSDARSRLEQGRLYELVMNSDLFSGSDADERAVRIVQRQIKKFAKEKMEEMLGMRQTVTAAPALVHQFNDLEVMLLKSLASKMSGGKTEEAEPEQYVEAAAPAPKKAAIKPISVAKPGGAAKALPKAPNKPIQRKPNQKPSPEELLGLPPEAEKPIGKPLNQMTEDEKIERSKRIAERQKAAKSARPANALPMPSEHQEEMLATARAREADSKGTVSTIMALLDASKR